MAKTEDELSLLDALTYRDKHEAVVDCSQLNVWRTWATPYTEEQILQLANDLLEIVRRGREKGDDWLDRHLATICFYRNPEMVEEPGTLCECDVCLSYVEYFAEEQFQREQRRQESRNEQRRRRLPRGARRRIFERDRHTCQDCGAQFDLTIDHRIPLAKNGSHEDSNLQALCRSCNSRKGTK